MRKKYLSALLFGALVMASTATFTSCKDYDDDIDNLQSQISANADAIKKLQDLVGAGKFVTNVSKVTDGITITWNDGSSTTLNGTDGKDGKDGKDGSVITIGENNNWFIDGKDTGVCAKGEKGDKGDKGEQGEQGPAGENGTAAEAGKDGADGHDAAIIDGYWAVWNAETGAYVKTNFIAGGVRVVEIPGGYKLTINNGDGSEQSIVLPTSAEMGYIDVLEMETPDNSNNEDMKVIYAYHDKDIEYGPADNLKTFQKGLYSTLDRDLHIVVNPQGVDASLYEFSLMNSENTDTQVKFQEAVPFKGLLSRATSDNGVWVLNNAFTRYEDINDARTKNYLLFKSNDGDKHALTLTAQFGDNVVKTPYDLGAKLKKYEKVQAKAQDIETLAVNTWRTPDVTNDEGVYDYWLTIEQSPSNLKRAILYGVEISEDGYSFRYTKNQGVSDGVTLVYNYILMDGSIYDGAKDRPAGSKFAVTLTEQMAAEKTITLERFETALDATKIDETQLLKATPDNSGATAITATEYFSLKTQAYSLAALTAEMSDTEKIVWKSALENNKVKFDLIGGEGNNNETWVNGRIKKNIRYSVDTAKDEITFQFLVSSKWSDIISGDYTEEKANFFLNNAYELTMTVTDENFLNTVATIVLPFEFTQPTLDITHINGLFTKWTKEDNGSTVLNVYGAYGDGTAKKMWAPLYEAFDMWTANGVDLYNTMDFTAKYYDLSITPALPKNPTANPYVRLLSQAFSTPSTPFGAAMTANKYFANYEDYNTYAVNSGDNTILGAAIKAQSDAKVNVDAAYKFYGIYPATQAQLGYYTYADAGTTKTADGFRLNFASLLKHSKIETKQQILKTAPGSHGVYITNDDLNMETPLGGQFFLFDGLDGDEIAVTRATLNSRSFNEDQRSFTAVAQIADTDNWKAVSTSGTRDYDVAAGVPNTNWKYQIDPQTGKVSIVGVNAHDTDVLISTIETASKRLPINNGETAATVVGGVKGGLYIQLPKSVHDGQRVTLTLTLKDGLGFKKDVTFIIEKL